MRSEKFDRFVHVNIVTLREKKNVWTEFVINENVWYEWWWKKLVSETGLAIVFDFLS